MMGRAVILACGNPLRGDDGVGLEILRRLGEGEAPACEASFHEAQQWTPELAELVSAADLAIFVDASEEIPPGTLRLEPLSIPPKQSAATTHSLNAEQLLGLAQELYGAAPAKAYLLTIGGQSFEFGERMSAVVCCTVSAACAEIRGLCDSIAEPHSLAIPGPRSVP